MKKRVLGRGLEALIPEGKRTEEPPLNEIDIDLISPNPNQPRLVLDEARLEELTASIRENGILQPVLVRPFGKGYQLIAGERRLSAAQRAGLLKIPAMIRDVPDDRLLEFAIVENIQREPLNPMEEALEFNGSIPRDSREDCRAPWKRSKYYRQRSSTIKIASRSRNLGLGGKAFSRTCTRASCF
jgi:hypothetical protein